ncbi:hypothetical protein QA633_41040 [Bradyrhizobium barranii]|uniref:hypothetical protein n=1 Tax=Bradyrhizobium barranii TaxID=2992140 RepID=UPI0024AF15DC|nr:hypothetical protein [Bradyrhizobium barranii]WFT94571.1 hypothetical protein QA633_41040 [Bradyrhizobium barranii]
MDEHMLVAPNYSTEDVMEEVDQDDELRARLQIVREELEAGRLRFAKDMKVIDSLKAVRYGPDGKVDLSTVDGSVRSLANVVTHFRQRRQATEAVSLRDLQETYFTYIERHFGWLHIKMKEQGASPSQVGAALAANPDAVADFKANLPKFLEMIDDLWEQTWDSAHYHVQDLTGLKAVFGGETFPSGRKNVVSSSGVYTDTIVLPDPFLRTKVFTQREDANAVRWCVKSAMALLNYREAALADVKVPLVVIAPDATYVDDEQRKAMVQYSEPSVIKHLRALFGVPFGSIEEAERFLRGLKSPQDVTGKLADQKRLLFHLGDNAPLEQQIEEYMRDYFSEFYEGVAGLAVLSSAMGRMRQATDLLRRSAWLGGTPLIDAPTSWQYFSWKLAYDAEGSSEGSDLNLHMTRALQNAADYEMEWLGKVPIEALIEMRKQNVMPELRQMLSQGVETLMELRPDNFHRTGDQVIKNIQDAFDEHRKNLRKLTGKKWRFAGVELGSCIAKGAIQIASAFGVPGVSLLGTAIDQSVDVPKLKDLPKKFRALKEEHQKTHRSAVGLLFNASRED